MTGPRRCLVLGGSGALGREVVRALALRGARVAFTWSRAEAVARALAEEVPGGQAIQSTFDGVASVERAVDQGVLALGGLDALVQCAGVAVTMECAGDGSHHRMPHVDEGGWDRMLDVNAKSTFFACRRVIAPLREAGGGNIVITGSVDGVKPVPSPVHYAASKGALSGMTQAMAKVLGPDGIKVNMVAPGIVEGGISKDIPPNLLAEYVKHCGLKRVARPAEIAGLIAWLAVENSYVTGQVILVDGGL